MQAILVVHQMTLGPLNQKSDPVGRFDVPVIEQLRDSGKRYGERRGLGI
jgi:hypothetical protein